MLNHLQMRLGLVVMFSVLASSPALAQEGCFDLDSGITVVRAQEYAPLIAQAAGDDVEPEQVEFISFTQSGSWSMIYASTPVADPGYFFFEDVDGQKEFRDVWGGVAFESEKAEAVSWAEDLGTPSDLAECFAETVADIPDEE